MVIRWTVLFLVTIIPTCKSYEFFKWKTEPNIDPDREPGLARTVFFIHMRKAAGTAVRQLFREIYQDLQCLPPNERKLVHSDQENWRCPNLAFYHVEWLCLAGSDIVQLRRASLAAKEASRNRVMDDADLSLDSSITFFYPQRYARFVTCLRHPIDRLISINWYGESSHGMQFMKHLQTSGGLGDYLSGTERPEGIHKRVWYRQSVDLAKQIAAKNATLWNQWILDVDQSTTWNYYITRLVGGGCSKKAKACQLAARCLAVGKDGHGLDIEEHTEVDPEHPLGCDALFSDDYTYPRVLPHKHHPPVEPVIREEKAAPPNTPSPLARWVESSLTTQCGKLSHKNSKSTNHTVHDLEDAKSLLTMFDVVLISERLGEPGSMKLMEKYFGSSAAGRTFPNANRGLFTHSEEAKKQRAAWQASMPPDSLKLMLQLNSLDINLYWFAYKLLDAKIEALGNI